MLHTGCSDDCPSSVAWPVSHRGQLGRQRYMPDSQTNLYAVSGLSNSPVSVRCADPQWSNVEHIVRSLGWRSSASPPRAHSSSTGVSPASACSYNRFHSSADARRSAFCCRRCSTVARSSSVVVAMETGVVTLSSILRGSTDVANRNAFANSAYIDEPPWATCRPPISPTAIHIPRDVLTTATLHSIACGDARELCYLCAHF
jgi:hypothetical protein